MKISNLFPIIPTSLLPEGYYQSYCASVLISNYNIIII